MGLVFDLIIVAIVLFFLIISIRKGAVRSLIEFIGALVSILLAVILSVYLSDLLFNLLLREPLLRMIEETLQSVSGQESVQQIAAVFDKLPGFISNSVNVDALSPQISDALSKSTQQAAGLVVDLAAAPVIKMLMRVVLTVLLYIIFRLLVRLIAFAGDRIARLPVLSQLNGLFGAILGIVKGALVVLILTAVIRAVIPMVESPKILTEQNIQNSHVFRYLYEHNPIFSLFEVDQTV